MNQGKKFEIEKPNPPNGYRWTNVIGNKISLSIRVKSTNQHEKSHDIEFMIDNKTINPLFMDQFLEKLN